MRRLIIQTFSIFILMIGTANAQSKMHKIQYGLNIEGTTENESIADIYVNKDFLRVENKFILTTVQISDFKNKVAYLLDNDNKTYTEQELLTDKVSVLDNGEALSTSDTNIEYVDGETKTIAGYSCKKALVKFNIEVEDEATPPAIEIWYSDQLPKIYWGEYAYLEKIPGAALSISTTSIGIQAIHVSELANNANLFVVPEDYELAEVDEFEFEPTLLAENRQSYFDESTSYIGLSDTTGNRVTPAKYSLIGEFLDGFAVVSDASNNYGLLNLDGKEVIPCQYEYLGRSEEGPFLFSKNSLFGYMNEKEEILIPATFSYARDFQNGNAIVTTDNGTGVIDIHGKEIIPTKFEQLSEYKDGSAVMTEGDQYYLIDTKGNKLTKAFEYISDGGDGLWLCLNKEKYGFINIKGQQIIPLKYNSAIAFEEGLSLVSENGEDYFYIDPKGKFVQKLETE